MLVYSALPWVAVTRVHELVYLCNIALLYNIIAEGASERQPAAPRRCLLMRLAAFLIKGSL